MVFSFKNIVSILGVILILSIPVMPTLIYGMHDFDQDQVGLRSMGNVSEEEEKVHSYEACEKEFEAEFEIAYFIHQPDKERAPFIETHCPPPDLNI